MKKSSVILGLALGLVTTLGSTISSACTSTPVPLPSEFSNTIATGRPQDNLNLRVYDDWVIGCDNVRSCHATSLRADPRRIVGTVRNAWGTRVAVKRDAGSNAPAIIQMNILIGLPGVEKIPVRGLRVDSRNLSLNFNYDNETGALSVPPCGDGAFISELMNGENLYFLDASGAVIRSASLVGMKDALRQMDVVQSRRDTQSALIAKGTKPYRAPPIQRRPVVVIAPPSPLPATQVRTEIDPGDSISGLCYPKTETSTRPRIDYDSVLSYRLDAKMSLVLVRANCVTPEGNLPHIINLVTNEGTTRVPEFDVVPRGAIPGVITNATWNAATQTLMSTYRLVEGGGCGSAARYGWNGEKFVIIHRLEMMPCRGSMDFVTTWSADVQYKRVDQ
jgi:hypothetical protein